jgi:DNA-binding CsgD family transcriptional regulator
MYQPQNFEGETIMKKTLHSKKSGGPLLNENQWLYIQRLHHLTAREHQIAELVCQGFKNRDIAKILHITAGTIKTHIRNIYRKTGVNSKIEMLLKFVSEIKDLSVAHHTAPYIPVVEVKKTAGESQTFSDIPPPTPKKIM